VEYAAVTPARDESKNLPRLAEALAAQTVRPRAWVIVENGSTDGTDTIAAALAKHHSWISVVTTPSAGSTVRGAPIVRAFNAGLESLGDDLPDVVFKLDADVSFPPAHFETVLTAFERRPRLGMASGRCLEETLGSQEQFVTGEHLWGAVRGYRRDCLADVLPLEEAMGWDTVDEVKARLAGWETAVVPEAVFHHHRLEGLREGRRRNAWRIQGEVAHFLGYRPSYVFARTLFRASRELSALAILEGFTTSALSRRPRVSDARVIDALRADQRLRDLGLRAREALGRSR
jgi:glycosyltransferase involved in cell wall biosynthesis